MESLKELYKIGVGPSSSHTLGPKKAAELIMNRYPSLDKVDVTLYGSLALTGKGHLTDVMIEKTFGDNIDCSIKFVSEALPYHPNGMKFVVYQDGQILDTLTLYSIGGGEIVVEGEVLPGSKEVYPHHLINDIIEYIENEHISLYDYVLRFDDEDIQSYLEQCLDEMFACVERGISSYSMIPGKLKLSRVARTMYMQALNTRNPSERERVMVSSYAYAVAEENACGHTIVTAPTCGASGVLPAVLYYAYKQSGIPKEEIVKALAVGGLFGNVIKYNATISGADGGCQAEIGSACAMTAASYAWLLELNNSLIEYAAEMGMEHNLGLTCDPVGGYVQIPCIERNGFAALRAMDAAIYAKQLGYIRKNKVSFDTIVKVMYETGKDLATPYKETSLGGLAAKVHIGEEM